MLSHEYLREALKNGLKVEQERGANPFKYGMAAGTDTHNGLTAAEEDNFYGKFPSAEPRADRWSEDAMKFGDRVVKGWVDKTGATHEKIFDVVWSNPEKRKVGADGKLTAVGTTVDVAHATWTNTIGAPELSTVWTDPEFDPTVRAFYYARALEIPTPRWTAYDAAYFKQTIAPNVPMTTQERAWSSPIWYTS